MGLSSHTVFAKGGCWRRIQFDTFDGTFTDHFLQCLKVDMSHTAVKLVDGYWTTRNIGVVFRGFRTLDSQRIKTVKVVNMRNRSKKGTVRSWATDIALTIFNSEETTCFIKTSNRNKGKSHFWCVIDSFKSNLRSLFTVFHRQCNYKVPTSDCRKGMSVCSSNRFKFKIVSKLTNLNLSGEKWLLAPQSTMRLVDEETP